MNAIAFSNVDGIRGFGEGALNRDVLVWCNNARQTTSGLDFAIARNGGSNVWDGRGARRRTPGTGRRGENRDDRTEKSSIEDDPALHNSSIVANGPVSNPGASLRTMLTTKPRVLIVDDERALRELLEYGLGQAGFAVRSVAEGSAALPVLQTWLPELIVLDVMLPDRDEIGRASCRERV